MITRMTLRSPDLVVPGSCSTSPGSPRSATYILYRIFVPVFFPFLSGRLCHYAINNFNFLFENITSIFLRALDSERIMGLGSYILRQSF